MTASARSRILTVKRTQLVSRNGYPFASFSDLGRAIAAALPSQRAVLDGEIVCLDRKGRPQFKDLLFRRGVPCFFAFDLLYDGKDRRRDALVDRKLELRRMIGRFSDTSRLQYADHIEETGTELFRHVCKLDLEGIVAKPKHSPYEREPARTSWYKIKNRSYSQMVGRHELFAEPTRQRTRQELMAKGSSILERLELLEKEHRFLTWVLTQRYEGKCSGFDTLGT